MQNSFLKNLGKSAKDAAIKSAKQVVHEPAEILKNTSSQISSTESKQIAPEILVIDELITGGGKVKELTPQEEASIHSQTKSRLEQIEAEIRRIRMEREQKSQEYAQKQQELLGPERDRQTEAAPLPSSGHKKGPRGPHQAKKGSREVGKQYGG